MAQAANDGYGVRQDSCETDHGDTIATAMAARRRGWTGESAYHQRSIAENMMCRLKKLGNNLYSRTFERQLNKAHVRAAIINIFTDLGLSQSVRVRQNAPAA